MKKISTFLFAVLLSAGMAFSQPVSDMGVIPIGVTLNSILRLNIVSGGNIEFVVSSIDQYTNGILNSTLYDTRFTVSSSVDFDVDMYAENASLLGTDDPAHTMPLNNIGYQVTINGTGAIPANYAIPSNAAVTALLSVAGTDIITGAANAAAGDAVKNDFTINWELATGAAALNAQSLLEQSLTADRYATNVFLILVGK